MGFRVGVSYGFFCVHGADAVLGLQVDAAVVRVVQG